jgi:NAD+ kinase
MEIRAVGICVKPAEPALGERVRELQRWLEARGLEVYLDPHAARGLDAGETPRADLAAKVDLLVVLGGDGTLLAAARAAGERGVPILGVNLGTLGFLVETSGDELYRALEEVLAGRFRVEERMRLSVSVDRGGERLGEYIALNDAVIARMSLSRMIDVAVRADGMDVTTYHADGLIVATPTGSSAYSLSAGGPLLLPDLEAIVLTPICPHTLTQRPLVLPQHCDVEIEIIDTRGGEVHVTADGQVGCEVVQGDRVRIRRSPHPLKLLVPPWRNRFEVMREKLGWGAR